MMTNNLLAVAQAGFVKRAMEYGMTEMEAKAVLTKHAAIFDRDTASAVKSSIGETLQHPGVEQAMTGLGGLAGGTGLAGPGAFLGMGVGGLTGLLNGEKDEKGETHRMRNALTGAGIGGGIGAGLGWGAGAVGGGILGNNAYQDALNSFKQ